MKLTIKFNLIIGLTFLAGLIFGGFYSYYLTKSNALEQVTDQAELIMQEALAVRSYTVNEIRPLLNNGNKNVFHPQTVPAYSATQISNIVRKTRPEYIYKEAVFNPTNPRDKATEWEREIINEFINDLSLKRQTGTKIINGVKSLYISYPIKITNPKCLTCHSTPEVAPAAMVDIYGDKAGFGWKLNEIIGTQMVVAPFTLPAKLARKTFLSFIASLMILFLLLFVSLNIMLRKIIISPIVKLTDMANNLSKGNLKQKEIAVINNDEIGELSKSFNRMRRSVIKILQLLKNSKK